MGRTACGLKLQVLAEAAGGIDSVSASAAVQRLAGRIKREAVVAALVEDVRREIEK